MFVLLACIVLLIGYLALLGVFLDTLNILDEIDKAIVSNRINRFVGMACTQGYTREEAPVHKALYWGDKGVNNTWFTTPTATLIERSK